MENRGYKVRRDNIYVGEVVRVDNLFRCREDEEFFNKKQGQLDTNCWSSYRSMLFVPNEEKLSNDLLYQSPNYPILNITDDKTCLALEEKSISIKDACNLATLLEYFGYDEDLKYDDIIKIRKTFFTGKFAKDNCELFGWKEIMAGHEDNHRIFFEISKKALLKEYWNILDDRGDNSLNQAILYHEKTNAFRPDRHEGPIKKLKRF